MRIESLKLVCFRNISETVFYPNEHINFLTGANGQGKTSVLEAIGFLSLLRSFRESKPIALIQWDQLASSLHCSLSGKDSSMRTELSLTLQKDEMNPQKIKKNAYINHKLYKSSVQYITQRFKMKELGFHAVIFNPADHALVEGDPSIRRAYLNRTMAAEQIDYLTILQNYERTLDHRNRLLKNPVDTTNAILRTFTEQLGYYGALLILARLKWIQRLNTLLPEMLKNISPTSAYLKVIYNSSCFDELKENETKLYSNYDKLGGLYFTGQAPLPSLELLQQAFWSKVSKCEAAERKVGYSMVGPHRDDWSFVLGIHPLKGYGSQGEVRSALLALKLSEIHLFRDTTGQRPLFLLDDFSSELDRDRRLFLMRYILDTDLQTFVTTTEDLPLNGKRYQVCNGAIEEGFHDNGTRTIKTE